MRIRARGQWITNKIAGESAYSNIDWRNRTLILAGHERYFSLYAQAILIRSISSLSVVISWQAKLCLDIGIIILSASIDKSNVLFILMWFNQYKSCLSNMWAGVYSNSIISSPCSNSSSSMNVPAVLQFMKWRNEQSLPVVFTHQSSSGREGVHASRCGCRLKIPCPGFGLGAGGGNGGAETCGGGGGTHLHACFDWAVVAGDQFNSRSAGTIEITSRFEKPTIISILQYVCISGPKRIWLAIVYPGEEGKVLSLLVTCKSLKRSTTWLEMCLRPSPENNCINMHWWQQALLPSYSLQFIRQLNDELFISWRISK